MTGPDLVDWCRAIETNIKKEWPGLNLVRFFYDDRDPPRLPALLLDIEELEVMVDDDPGTGQLAAEASLTGRFVLNSLDGGSAQAEAAHLATGFASWLRCRYWNDPKNPGRRLKSGAAFVQRVYREEFAPELDKYAVWSIDWKQEIMLGKIAENNDFICPDSLHVKITGAPE